MNPQPQALGGAASVLWRALKRGFGRHCPRCGQGMLFRGYTKVEPACGVCGLGLESYHVDDAPPYFTILIVGHIVVPGMLLLEQFAHPPLWLQLGLWLPVTLMLALLLLPKVKGALLGLHWANGIRG